MGQNERNAVTACGLIEELFAVCAGLWVLELGVWPCGSSFILIAFYYYLLLLLLLVLVVY